MEVTVSGNQPDLPPDVSLHLLRIGQEALTNALKHARAQLIHIHLTFASHQVQLLVQDDGQGFALPKLTNSTGFGLRGIQQRATQIGAHLEVSSKPDAGTKIQLTLPLAVSHGSHHINPTRLIRILVADDHPVVLEGLVLLLDNEPDLTVVASAHNGLEAVELFRQHQPDVALLDLRMPGEISGVEAITRIHAEFPDACIILLTIYDGDEDIFQGLRAGAKAYLLKSTSSDELLSAIRQVCAGQKYIPPSVGVKLAERMGHQQLSERERSVLCLMAAGKTNKDIAASLSIAEGTVKFHVNNILSKLGVSDRTQAVIAAFRRGIASPWS